MLSRFGQSFLGSIVAECIHQSLVATPEHLYNSEAGVQMLGVFQENYLTDALDEMQEMGMITKVQSEQNRRIPGRNYVFASK